MNKRREADQPSALGTEPDSPAVPVGPEGSGLSVGVVVAILPTKVWVESDMMGARHVVVHHEGHGEPFTYASFNYNYSYTSNSGTWHAANRLAIELGATEPVDQRQRFFQRPTADELREQIKVMQKMLAGIEGC